MAGYDRGELTLHPGRIVFRGMRSRVECLNVTSVEWAAKPFPWPITIAVGLAAFALPYLKSPDSLAWDRPLPYILLGILLVVSVLQFRERWVVACHEDGGVLRRAYFQRSPIFGFGSSRKRTQRLFDDIRARVLQG